MIVDKEKRVDFCPQADVDSHFTLIQIAAMRLLIGEKGTSGSLQLTEDK
jgi:hypothetical protein